MHGIGFLADQAPAYEVGTTVRVYGVTRDGLQYPLNVTGRVVKTERVHDGTEPNLPLWLYDIATADNVYTGIPASRVATYGGSDGGLFIYEPPFEPVFVNEFSPLPHRVIGCTVSL